MTLTKKISLILAAALSVSALGGCSQSGGEKKTEGADGKTTIVVADWPTEEKQEELKQMNDLKASFEEKYPDITIEPSTYVYNVDTFLPKAMSGQLPDLYKTYYTEIDKITDGGYAADLTGYMTENDMVSSLNSVIKDVISKDGKYYAIPTQLYVQGLLCNVDIFKEAGLTDENGIPKFPKTYEELAQTAKTIKDKTGKSGFALPTTANCGGWHFMNIAWSYGVKFMEEKDGKWTAAFDTQECYDALQYVKDLKWKYDVLPTNTFTAMSDLETLWSTDQLAMYFRPADGASSMINTYGVSKDNFSYGRIPEGPKGRIAQMGGTVYMISNTATEDKIDAAMKWIEYQGFTPTPDDTIKTNKMNAAELSYNNGYVSGITGIPIWTSDEAKALDAEIAKEYANVNLDLFKDYQSSEGVEIRPEEAQKCQELYGILDSCIQAVITDENADVKQLIHQAAADFQANYLDKLK